MNRNIFIILLHFIRELGYAIFVFVVCNIVGVFYKPKQKFLKEKINVVLVHGMFTTGIMLFPLKIKLEKMGLNVISFEYGFGLGNITENAEKLNKFLEKNMDGVTVLLGHSLGGLIIVEAKRINAGIMHIPTVTLASPIKGTPLAYSMYYLHASRQLVPNSVFIKQTEVFVASLQNIVFVKAVIDEIVFNGYSCPSIAQCKTINILGHISLAYHISYENLYDILFKELAIKKTDTIVQPS